MRLRTYQLEAIRASEKAIDENQRSLVVLPTGSGKTRIFAEVAKKFHKKTGKRVLIVAPRRDLVEYAETHIKTHTKLSCDVEMAERHANGATVVCASAQSLAARLSQYRPKQFGLLIFDEADLAVAPTYRKIAEYFKGAKEYGCTATPERLDGISLNAKTVYNKTLREMIDAGWLVPIRQHSVKILETHKILLPEGETLDASKPRIKAGDFDSAWLDKIFTQEKSLFEVVVPLLEKAGDRPTLVFGTSVRQAELLAGLFNRLRPGCARSVSGNSSDRYEVMASFRRREFQFLCNCVLINRGVDLPFVSCVGMARPTLSKTLYMQMLGRGTRLSEGKSDLLVLDYTFNATVFGHDIFIAFTDNEEISQHAREQSGEAAGRDIREQVDEAEAQLKADPALRARVSATVSYRLRQIEGVDWSQVTDELWRMNTDREIAKLLEVCPKSVRRRRPENIPSPRTRGRYDFTKVTLEDWTSKSNAEIAVQLNCSVATVAYHRLKTTPSPLMRVQRIFKDIDIDWANKTNKEISIEYGVSMNSVRDHRPKETRSPHFINFSTVTETDWKEKLDITIAKELGCSISTVSLKRPKNIPSPRIANWLHIPEEMFRNFSNKEIARRFDVSPHTVRKRRPLSIPSVAAYQNKNFDWSQITREIWDKHPNLKIAKLFNIARESVRKHRPKDILSSWLRGERPKKVKALNPPRPPRPPRPPWRCSVCREEGIKPYKTSGYCKSCLRAYLKRREEEKRNQQKP